MGKGGLGITMTVADLSQRRDNFLNGVKSSIRKVVVRKLKEYYSEHNNSFNGIDCKKIADESRNEIREGTKNINIGLLEISKEHYDRIIGSVKEATVKHFMKIIDEKAYNEFITDKNNDDLER